MHTGLLCIFSAISLNWSTTGTLSMSESDTPAWSWKSCLRSNITSSSPECKLVTPKQPETLVQLYAAQKPQFLLLHN